MAYHLPPVQPLWSFVSPVTLPCFTQDVDARVASMAQPVQGWSLGPDGRPRMRFKVQPRED
jgi:hypothetical protein